MTEAVKCAEELKTLRMNGEAAPKDVEHRIVQYATDMDDHGFGLNMKIMMWLTQWVAAAYGMQGFKATYRWLTGLFCRYPELAKRRSQAFQRLRATQISEYFTILQKAIDECLTADDLMEMDPNLIANLDETNIT